MNHTSTIGKMYEQQKNLDPEVKRKIKGGATQRDLPQDQIQRSNLAMPYYT